MKSSIKLIFTVFVTLAALSFSSCEVEVDVEVDFDYDTFCRERDLWNSTKPNSYQYSVHIGNSIWYSTDATVTVEDGVYKDQVFTESGDGGSGGGTSFTTIDALYDYIDKYYQRYNHSKKNEEHDTYVKSIDVTYDSLNHFPYRTDIRWYVPKNLADAPGQEKIEVTDFQITDSMLE